MITALDHIALAVGDLDAAVAGYRILLGREPTCVREDNGAWHARFQLETMALKVISPDGSDAVGAAIGEHLDTHGESIWAMALAVDDVGAAKTLVSRRGLRASAPRLARHTHSDGRSRRRTTSAIDPRDIAGIRLFLVETPLGLEPWPLSGAIGDQAGCIAGLDHLVIHTPNSERAVANWAGRLGLDLRLDRSNETWGVQQLFFRCGPAVVEFSASLTSPITDGDDTFGGLAWRANDAAAVRARLSDAGFDVSEVRDGRKPGSRVFTIRSGVVGAPALVIEQGPRHPLD